MFTIGDLVEMYSMAEDKTYYGVITSCDSRNYYRINWLHEQNPPFYSSVHESILKKVSNVSI
jgi:hypothetical protein